MPKFIALLGNSPALSVAEFEAVYPEFKITTHSNQVAIWGSDNFSPEQAIEILGGTIKIFRVLKEIDQLNPQDLEQVLASLLSDSKTKVNFGVAEIGRDHLPAIDSASIKQNLKDLGVNSRFVESPRSGLSASVLTHQKVTELAVVQTDKQTLIAQTITTQDIDNWTIRDREKPYFDRKKGMLPPKVARMMVNLALGEMAEQLDSLSAESKPTVLDPFCGSGTVLLESAVLGCHAIGSDLDQDACEGTRTNLAWLQSKYQLDFNYQVYQKDASKLELNQPINYLITEPFLGKPTPKPEQLPNIFRGLEKLYLGAFKQWSKFLADGAKLVVVFPETQVVGSSKRFSLQKLIDKLSPLGYTSKSEPLIYRRPNAIIERAIHQFTFERK